MCRLRGLREKQTIITHKGSTGGAQAQKRSHLKQRRQDALHEMLEDDQMDESGNIHTMKNDVEVVGGERDVEVGNKILVNEDRRLSSGEREGRKVHRDWQKERGCRGKGKREGVGTSKRTTWMVVTSVKVRISQCRRLKSR